MGHESVSFHWHACQDSGEEELVDGKTDHKIKGVWLEGCNDRMIRMSGTPFEHNVHVCSQKIVSSFQTHC